jgi:hypothetical protein
MVSNSGSHPPAQPLHPFAELYGQWTFNFLVDVAGAMANDFVERPQHYRKVPDDLTNVLSCFRSFPGAHPDWPDAEQRTAVFRNLSAACLAGAPLREAALLYVELATERNDELLLDAFRDTAVSFRNQIRPLDGQSLRIGCRQVSSIFNNAVKLFKNNEVVGVFDLPGAPEDNWPLGGNYSEDGAYTVAEAIRALEGVAVARPRTFSLNRPLNIAMTLNKFSLLQRAAYHGGAAISQILTGTHEPDDLRGLLGNTYKWTKALQRLIPDTVRVWKDEIYRVRLTDIERGMVDPHPCESINFPGARMGGFGYATATVHGEVCCCTGDLNCSSNCEWSPNPSCINCPTLGAIGCMA